MDGSKFNLLRFKYELKQLVKKILRYDYRAYKKYLKEEQLSEEEREMQRQRRFQSMPLISIVVPLIDTKKKYLDETINSILNQTYSNWEICFTGSKIFMCSDFIKRYCENNPRMKCIFSSERDILTNHIDRAFDVCQGEYVAFLDCKDKLAENALYECVKYINLYQTVEVIYTDEDRVSNNGKNFSPHFKPDFNKDLFYSCNYIGHLLVLSRELILKVRRRKEKYKSAQEYDLLLRCLEMTEEIVHIPKILYHRRGVRGTHVFALESTEEKSMAEIKALQDYFDRNGIEAKAKMTETLGIHRVQYDLVQKPKVTIIIPNKDHVEDLCNCLDAIRKKAGYDNYEILIIENNSENKKTFEFYRDISRQYTNVKVIFWKGKFNYAAINNWGVQFASGELLLFLNNDVEWISDDFLKEMVSVSLRKEVGIVGCLLFFPDDSIQHAGVIMGYSGIAGHAFIGTPRGVGGYYSRIVCMQEYSAVTAACLMIKKEIFQNVNGFDESFEVAFNDIDLCLRVLKTGKLIVYDPYAQAYHYESKTRGSDSAKKNIKRFDREKELLRKKWGNYIDNGDPYYNRNLTLKRPDFVVREEK